MMEIQSQEMVATLFVNLRLDSLAMGGHCSLKTSVWKFVETD